MGDIRLYVCDSEMDVGDLGAASDVGNVGFGVVGLCVDVYIILLWSLIKSSSPSISLFPYISSPSFIYPPYPEPP